MPSRPLQVESQLLPGFEKLGLDPAQVKVILVTHGHADHFGGGPTFRSGLDQRFTFPRRIGT